jgi:ABC-type phosphate/phosphonate transport system permease subunit
MATELISGMVGSGGIGGHSDHNNYPAELWVFRVQTKYEKVRTQLAKFFLFVF